MKTMAIIFRKEAVEREAKLEIENYNIKCERRQIKLTNYVQQKS